MFRIVIVIAVLLTLMTCSGYYLFYPPELCRRSAQHLLDGLAEIIASQDKDAIQKHLSNILADSADITLEVDFPSPPGQRSQNSDMEKFGKSDFLHFVDTTLFSLSDYYFKPYADGIIMDKDKKAGLLTLHIVAKAHGLSGSVMDGNVGYIGQSTCSAKVAIEMGKVTNITNLSCQIILQYTYGK